MRCGAKRAIEAADHLCMPVSRDAVPCPFCSLVIEQAGTRTAQDRRGHRVVFRNACDRSRRDRPPEHFAFREAIQRQPEAIMPLHATTERASGVFYGSAAKGWVEHDRLISSRMRTGPCRATDRDPTRLLPPMR